MSNDDETAAIDPYDKPEYHALVEAAAKGCRNCPSCSECPCPACLAGGVCDDRECHCDEKEEDGYDPLGCPGCGGNCVTACR